MHIINIILLVIIVLEFLLLGYFLFDKRVKKENKTFLLFSIIILFILVLTFYLKADIFIKTLGVNNIILLIITTILAIILQLNKNILELDNKYNKSIDCIIEYEKIIDEQGKTNHEYKNQLMILKGYINDKDKLEEYLDLLIDVHRKGQSFKIKQLSKFPNGGIKQMLYYKISKIKENNIKYYLYISKDVSLLLEKLDIELYSDVTKILGVLLDNAIEASSISEGKEISIDFSKEDNYIVITISNSYKEIGLNKKIIFNKENMHGFGLRLAKDIIKKNNNLELVTDHDDKFFNQTILIDIKK